jgi:cytoskeletal protein CcmA (bactofilin family)
VFNRRKPDEAAPAETSAEQPVIPLATGPTLPPAPADNGLDVPPYRPAAFAPPPNAYKDTTMARSPFTPAMPPAPNTPLRPHNPSPSAPLPARDAAERRTLVVGRGISVQGTVQDAERLVVEGTVEANMINGLTELSITHGGVFKGEVEVDEAEVAGTIDGTLTARHALIVRATGRVLGVARCRRLQVEDGGQITGRIEMISEPGPAAPHIPAPVTAEVG